MNPYYRPRWRHYYWPYGYSSYTLLSLSFGVSFGYGYTPFYPAYGYPGYGYAAYGQPTYGYRPYGYPEYGVVRYAVNRRASVVIRPAPAYRGSPLLSTVQGISASGVATRCDPPLNNLRKNDTHTVHHGPEGQGVERAM